MWGILGVFLQAAAGQILYLALHLESGSFPRPLSPAAERAAFAALRTGGVAGRDARDQLVRHNLRLPGVHEIQPLVYQTSYKSQGVARNAACRGP